MTVLIDQIVEQRIAKAIENGEFDDLPKQGEPLILDDDNGVPEHLRMGYRILKMPGIYHQNLSLVKKYWSCVT